MTPTTESLLLKGLKEFSLPFDPEKISAFMTYLNELKKWNRAYNLTSLRSDEDIVIKHFLDSLLYLKALPEGRLDIMDVGSGAGFPGIPLKIIRPEMMLYLVEPSRKKVAFLEHIVRTLRFKDVKVIEKKVEDISGIKVDAALTRALFDIEEFYKKASHLLREGGRLILSKGPKIEEELKKIKGRFQFETLKIRLPLTDIYRYIVIIYHTSMDIGFHDRTKGHKSTTSKDANICINLDCRLRRAGCKGFEGCPGFKARA